MENQLTSRNDTFQIVKLLERYLKYWPWFLLSGIFCCMIAVLYVKSTPRLFRRTASVLISEENYQDITAAFGNGSPFAVRANVNNEIEAFKSPQLMQETVRRLKLNVKYVMKEGLRKVDKYTQSPIIAVFPYSHDAETFSFQVELLPDSVIVLSKFVRNGDKLEQDIRTRLNKETATPIGYIMISPSLYYSRDRNYPSVKVSKNDVKVVALQFSGTLNVYLSSKLNSIIALEIDDESIQRAEDILKTVIDVYNENWLAEKNRSAVATLSFLNERIPIIEAELTEIDGRLAQYKRSNQITDVRNVASMQVRESMEYSARIIEVSNQVSIVNSIREYLYDNTKVSEPLPSNISGVNHVALESAISNYNTQLANRNRLLANSSEQNPVIIDINNSLHTARQSITQTVDNLLSTLNMQLSGLKSQEARMTSGIASSSGQERYLMTVEREQKLKETLYLYLLQQREENEMALNVNAKNSRIISSPYGNMFPIKPNKMLVLLIAIFIGIGIPGGIILVRDTINMSIRDKNDLASLPVPLLGIIPEVKNEVKREGMLVVQDHGKGAVNESFRIIRTSLGFVCSKGMKIIQVTSMEPGAGKTFTTLNLAMSFAVAGKKIALLDMDLRRLTLSNFIGNPEFGIANILSGMELNDEKFIQKDYFYPGFDVIPVGAVPSTPSELLMSDVLTAVIEKLKESYDYIFIDSPPVGPIADATIIAQLADVSVFVVREKFTDWQKLLEIKDIFNVGKFKNMRLVLNGSIAETQSNKYYNSYY